MECLFEDARKAINECFYTEVAFADDLNAYRIFSADVDNEVVKANLKTCQHELHKWGAANQVAFDAAKESCHILSTTEPLGDGFKLLGVAFDECLTMSDAVSETVTAAGWKMRALLRTRRFHTDAVLIVFYKSHVIPKDSK